MIDEPDVGDDRGIGVAQSEFESFPNVDREESQ
jgi:hypothetical protein